MNTTFTARGSRGEIWLYDPIGSSYFGDSISAKSFQKELTALGKVDTINLHINSPGGDVWAGFAIYNQLKAHPATIIVDVDGVAASIASIIAMAGDTIRVAKNAMVMIHNPQGGAYGDEKEMERTAALLRQVKDSLTPTYVDRTGNKPAAVSAWMDDETWFTADAAVENGFADAITPETPVANCFDLSPYRNAPQALKTPMPLANMARAMNAIRLADASRKVAALCKP